MDFEKLGAFYLGRGVEGLAASASGQTVLYDSRDLTTHGLIVGMTGSGKTGLAAVLLEEALLDGVPSLVIDPKGDMANLMLRFEHLAPEEFRPFIDPLEASRAGRSVEEVAAAEAEKWKAGLEKWGQSGDRITALKRAGRVDAYTPGDASGRPIALLRGLDPPPETERNDAEAMGDRVVNTVSGLLGLAGIEADPITSREHVLLSKLIDLAWQRGEAAGLEQLIRAIPDPPFERLGVLDIETYYPAKERLELATRLNNLLASRAFAAWREGESLDVGRLLFGDDGRPRCSVFYIAHLSDEERMFFVTLFLEEVIAWMRRQKGTSSLRALLYMDEVFGFFPPVRTPPSKAPMLTLLKQARAFGLGCVLATQNPVDLDYKGLANIGTWFLGRLQTARDRDRLVEGLDSARGAGMFDREQTESLLSSLPKRTFLMHDVHEDAPLVFETRWAMSYLSGPLTLAQVRELARRQEPESTSAPSGAETAPAKLAPPPTKPLVEPGVDEVFLRPQRDAGGIYEPFLWGRAQLHYSDRKRGVDHWETLDWLTVAAPKPDWGAGQAVSEPVLEREAESGVGFASLPTAAGREKSYATWRRSLASFLYRERRIELMRAGSANLISRPGEEEGAFRGRVALVLRERRDAAVEDLRARYAKKIARATAAVHKAEERLARENEQYGSRKLDTVVDFGVTLAGALFGRKLGSLANARRASRAAKSASRANRERADVAKASATVEAAKASLAELEAELERELEALALPSGLDAVDLERLELAPRKSDIEVERLALAWRRAGTARPTLET